MPSEQVGRRIGTVMQKLPPLPTVVQKLLAVMRDENSSADDVTRVLKADQALAGKILRLVNSSYYGLAGEVSTVSRAVVILGFSGIRNVALGLGTMEALGAMGSGSKAEEFWEHSLAAAAAGQCVAQHCKATIDPEEVFVASLLHDVGQLVLSAAVPDDYAAVLDGTGELVVREKERLGVSHDQVAYKLLQHWRLPEALCEAARCHHNLQVAAGGSQLLTTCVALGDALACVHGGAYEPPAGEAALGRLAAALELERSDLFAVLDGMEATIERTKTFLQVAGREAPRPAGSGGGEGVVVLSGDPDRSEWATGLLTRFGQQIVPPRDFFARSAGCDSVRLVLVDPQCVTRAQLGKILPFLDASGIPVVILAADDPAAVAPDLRDRYPVVGYVFSRAEIARLMQVQLA
ncbi:MAG: HDOD domain-containing protein [Candidatus Krumholzibacteriia bacterium]